MRKHLMEIERDNCNWCEGPLESRDSFNGVCFDCFDELLKRKKEGDNNV